MPSDENTVLRKLTSKFRISRFLRICDENNALMYYGWRWSFLTLTLISLVFLN